MDILVLQKIALLAGLGLAQSASWMFFFWLYDFRDPEPRSFLFKLFLWGVYAATPILALEYGADFLINQRFPAGTYTLLGFMIAVAIIEEYIKYLVVLTKVWHTPNFNQIVDGVIYGVTLAMGFSFVENAMYLISISRDHEINSPYFFKVVIVRFLLTTLMHAVASGFIGLEVGFARYQCALRKQNIRIFLALLLAAGIHICFNILMLHELLIPAGVLLGLVLCFLLLHFFRRADYLVKKPPVCPVPVI